LAAAAAYFSWHQYHNPLLTIGASVVAFCLGGLIGYKFAIVFTALLGVAIIAFAVLIYLGSEMGKKAREDAAFDPKSLSTTLLWMEAQGGKVTEVEAKKNEVMSKDALEAANRTLAGAEGKQVQWQSTVESVSPTTVTLQRPSMGSGYSFTFDLVAAKASPEGAEPPHGLALPITAEQSRKLTAGQTINFTGRVRTCRADRSGGNLAFALVVSEARVAD
jgi:hypothetical protein